MTVEITSPSNNAPARLPPVLGLSPSGKTGSGEKGQARGAPEQAGSPAGVASAPDTRGLLGQSLSVQPADDTKDGSSQQDMEHQELLQAVDQIKEFVQSLKRNLEFSVDSESGREVVKVIDAETDKVIRQIPPEEVLKIARHFHESMGSLIRLEA